MRTLAAAERYGLELVEELRVRHASLSAQKHLVRALDRLFMHLRKRRIRDVRSVRERDVVSFARVLQKQISPRQTPLTLTTQAIYLQQVRQFFDFLVRRGVVIHNPAAELSIPHSSPLPRRLLSEREVHRLVTAPSASSWRGKRDRAILELLYGTGIRRGECVRLDVTDVDLREGRLLARNTKGKKDRVVPLTGRAAASLDIYLRDVRPRLLKDLAEQALFLTWYRKTARRMADVTLAVIVRRYASRVGIVDAHAHGMRHAFATHLLRNGADVRHVQELLGHQRLTTTALYTRVSAKELLEVLDRCHPRERQMLKSTKRKPS